MEIRIEGHVQVRYRKLKASSRHKNKSDEAFLDAILAVMEEMITTLRERQGPEKITVVAGTPGKGRLTAERNISTLMNEL